MSHPSTPDLELPFSGVKVIDLSRHLPGPGVRNICPIWEPR